MQLLSPDGRTLAVNDAWKDLWKIPDEIIQNYILKDYNVGKDLQLDLKGIGHLIRKGLSGETIEIPPILYDPAETGLAGEPKWVTGYMYPIKNLSGELEEIVLTHRDITQTKKAEEELRRSRDQLQFIFEGVLDGILVQDKDFRPIYANEAAARMCGFESPQKLISASIEEILSSFEIRDEIGNPLPGEELPARHAMSGKGSQENVVMRVHNLITGEETWSIVSAKAINDEKGIPFMAVSIFRDITADKKRQERVLFLSEATNILSMSLDYRETLNKIAKLAVPKLADWCSIDVMEEDGPKTLAVAHADPEMLKFAEELTLKYPPDWNAPTGSPNVLRTGIAELYPIIPEELLEKAAQDPEHFEILKKLGLKSAMIVPLKLKDQTMGTITFIGAESGRVYNETDLEMAKELGARSALALENAKLYRRSEQLTKDLQNALNARDEFISVCSHELKTPITSMKLQFQLAEKMLADGDMRFFEKGVAEKRVISSNRQIDRMVRLIDEMLDISRINVNKLDMEKLPLDMREILEETLGRFENQFKSSSIEITTDLPEGNWFITGDKFRIEQVLSNIITNAIKYGGSKPISVRLLQNENHVRIEISDSGIGIATEDLERIFNRFERVASSKNITGLGLGLFISKQIVLAHKGKIWAERQQSGGTTFIVELPSDLPS